MVPATCVGQCNRSVILQSRGDLPPKNHIPKAESSKGVGRGMACITCMIYIYTHNIYVHTYLCYEVQEYAFLKRNCCIQPQHRHFSE